MSTENDPTSDAPSSVRRKARLRVVDSPVVRRSSRGSASRARSSREEWSREDSAEERPSRRSEKPRPVSPERARWNELTEGVLSIHGAPFDPTRSWKEGDILLHKQFGMGVCEPSDDIAPAQIRAIFRDGEQVLDLTLPESD